MLKRHRTLLFLGFSLSFFVTSGSILFYTYGYRFSLERGIFIYTGSLSLKTNVEAVSIAVDNVTLPERRLGLLNNSIHIAGLNPGEHMIEVSAPRYRTWSKKVVIQSGITTEFWNIFLTEENYSKQAVSATENVIRMFPAPNGLFATVKKADRHYAINVLDIAGEKDTEVYATDEAAFLPEKEENIEWSPESHKLIIPLMKEGTPLSVVVNIKTKEMIDLNTTTNIKTAIRSPRWDATTKDFLFFLDGTTLYRYDTSSPETAPKLVMENVAGYDLSGNKLYYLSSANGVVYQISGNGSVDTPKQITPAPIALGSITDRSSLIVYDDTRLSIIKEDTGTLYTYNKRIESNPLKVLGTGVKSLQYSDDGKKLLYFTDSEITVYFNQNWEAQPFRAADSIIQIARFSSPIMNVQWAEDYEHVIFSLGKNIKMIELDNRDRRGLADLLSLDAEPLQILPRFQSDSLYVVNESSSPALAGNTVFSITLPQYATFLGF